MEKKHKERVGVVVSDKMDKTVIIAVETPKRHPLYKKTIKRYTKFKAHNENNLSKEGDTVRIVETRPLSKDKRWRVSEVIAKGKTVTTKPEEISDSGTA